MNIVLTGLRGSGKTMIGEALKKILDWDLVDIDDEIEKAEGQKIAKIVEGHGWKYFREREKEAAFQAAVLDKTIIACGGGTIIDIENERALKKNGKIIYLYRKPEDCAEKIINSKNRPPLTNKESTLEELKELYKQRNGRYCESADIVFQRTDDIEEDTKRLIEELKKFSSFNEN